MAELVTRHPQNPLLTADAVPYDCSLLFNAGVCRYQGKYVMVFRNDYGCSQQEWEQQGKRLKGTNLGIAFSDDGVDWQVQPKPLISLDQARQLAAPLIPGCDPVKEIQRFYDPRLTEIEGRIYMTFAVDTAHGLRGGVLVTDDFENFEVLSLSLPDNRNMVLFPEKIDGSFVRLDRPMPVYSRAGDRFDLWLIRSPDLRHWGREQLVLGVEDVPFADDKIGPAAPPVKTDRGWLTTFHAVERDGTRGKNGWEEKWQKIYYGGLMLLDLENPAKVLGLVREPLLAPQAVYETDEGFRTHVIFPGGMLLEDDGTVKIYYGASDTVECLATGEVDQLVEACLANPLS